jgi:uroporphyrinogen-III synthase/uroporphyrinogen III methyltransferase/synthase
VTPLVLAGRRVLVTRALHQAGKLSDGLRVLGAEPVEIPVLEIRPPVSFEPLDAALRQLDSYDWLILASANAARALAERTASLELPLTHPSDLKVATVGAATAEEARKAGLRVDFVPPTYTAESLSDGMSAQVTGKRILIVRGVLARDVLPDGLRAAGGKVDIVDAYRNQMPEAAPEQLRLALDGGIDAATFTSSSSATHLAEAARLAGIPWPLVGVPAISIGPISSQTLRELGWESAAEANPHDIPGLIDAVVRLLHA